MKSLMSSATAQNMIYEFRKKTNNYQKYSNYSAIATQEGYLEISDMFKKMAKNCNEHARMIAKFLVSNGYNSEDICTMTAIPILCSDTITNLQNTTRDEAYNAMSVYPDYVKAAYDEEYLEVAVMLYNMGSVSEEYAKRCANKSSMIQNDTYLKKNEIKKWVCNRCGYVYKGYEAPTICPLCIKDRKYFEQLHDEE